MSIFSKSASKYILDTNIIVYWLNGNKLIEKKIIELGLTQLGIPFIVACELYYGAYHSAYKEKNLAVLKKLFQDIPILIHGLEEAEIFGKLKAQFRQKGHPIDDADLIIASCAITRNQTIVTHNLKHFQRIPQLSIEDWFV